MVSINSKSGNAPLQQPQQTIMNTGSQPHQLQFDLQGRGQGATSQHPPSQINGAYLGHGKISGGSVLSPRRVVQGDPQRDNSDRIQTFYDKLDKQIQQKKTRTRQVVLKKHTQGEVLGKNSYVVGTGSGNPSLSGSANLMTMGGNIPTPQPNSTATSMVQYVKELQNAGGATRMQNVPSASMDYQAGKVTVQQLNSRELYAQQQQKGKIDAINGIDNRGGRQRTSQENSLNGMAHQIQATNQLLIAKGGGSVIASVNMNLTSNNQRGHHPASISQMEMLQAQIIQQIQSQNNHNGGSTNQNANNNQVVMGQHGVHPSSSTPKEQRRRLLESMPAGHNPNQTSASLPQQPVSSQVSSNYLGLLVNAKPMMNDTGVGAVVPSHTMNGATSTHGATMNRQVQRRITGSSFASGCSNFTQLEVAVGSASAGSAVVTGPNGLITQQVQQHQSAGLTDQRKKRSSNEIFNGIRILNKRTTANGASTNDSNDKLLESVVVAQRTAVTSIGGSRLSQNNRQLQQQRLQDRHKQNQLQSGKMMSANTTQAATASMNYEKQNQAAQQIQQNGTQPNQDMHAVPGANMQNGGQMRLATNGKQTTQVFANGNNMIVHQSANMNNSNNITQTSQNQGLLQQQAAHSQNSNNAPQNMVHLQNDQRNVRRVYTSSNQRRTKVHPGQMMIQQQQQQTTAFSQMNSAEQQAHIQNSNITANSLGGVPNQPGQSATLDNEPNTFDSRSNNHKNNRGATEGSVGITLSANQIPMKPSSQPSGVTNVNNLVHGITGAQTSASGSNVMGHAMTGSEKRVNSIDNYILKLTSQNNVNPGQSSSGQPTLKTKPPTNGVSVGHVINSQHDAITSSTATGGGHGPEISDHAPSNAMSKQQQVQQQQMLQSKPREKFKLEMVRDDLPGQQKQLWQQLQLLKLLRQDYKGLNKNHHVGPGSGVGAKGGYGARAGVQQQITHQYGFQMTEEEMFNRIFRYTPAMKGKQNYAQLECLECLKLTNKMLGEELALLVQARHKRQGKAITIALTADGRLKSASKQQIGSEVVVGYNFTRRSKSNNGQMRGVNGAAGSVALNMPPGIGGSFINGEMTVEQAAQLLNGSPQIFMRKQINDPYFAPIVTGQGIHGIAQGNNTMNGGQGPFIMGGRGVMGGEAGAEYEDPSSATGIMMPVDANGRLTAKQVLAQGAKETEINGVSQVAGVNNNRNKKTRQPSKMSSDDNIINDKQLQIYDGMSKRFRHDYPAANLATKPTLVNFKHLRKSQINQTIQKINQVILCLFKTKLKPDDQQIIKLLKHFQIPVPKSNGLGIDMNEVKKPDFLQMVNVKLMQKLYRVLNSENDGAKPDVTSNYFRFFVGAGNNYTGVRQIIKRRSWWHRYKREQFIGMNAQGYSDSEGGSGDEGAPGIGYTHGGGTNQGQGPQKIPSGAHFIWTQWRKTELHEHLRRKDKAKGGPAMIYGKLEDNFHLANKKALFMNISNYYRAMNIEPFEVAIPLTFHIKSQNDPEYKRFIEVYQQNAKRNNKDTQANGGAAGNGLGNGNIWIIKPGENSNRGVGIQVADSLSEIKSIVHSIAQSNGNRTAIVQKYIEKPLLISQRKFDIRAFAMLTSVNGCLKGYMYRDCYFRTSCKTFDLSNLASRYVHLTNDAVQQNSEEYGKYENGNKLSINDFQRYLDLNHPSRNICFMRDLFPQIERLITDSFRAVMDQIDPRRLSHSFEVFGYDFMIDENFKVYLIEANTNPSLEICSPLLARIIPELLDNSFRIAVDPLFQPPQLLIDEPAPNNSRPTDLSPMPRPCLQQVNGYGLAPVKTNSSGQTNNNNGGRADKNSNNHHGTGTKGDNDDDGPTSPPAQTKQAKPQNSNGPNVNNGHDNNNVRGGGNGHGNIANQNQKIRKRFELMPSIKYTLVFDERVDRPELDKLMESRKMEKKEQDQLLEEIKEEEKVGEREQAAQQKNGEKGGPEQSMHSQEEEGAGHGVEHDQEGEQEIVGDELAAQMDAQEDEGASDSDVE